MNREPLNLEPYDSEPLKREPRIVDLRFTIQDTGIGIHGDNVPHLFNKFYQEDASTTRKFGGTGLGLAISKQLAEMMGGEIGVSSVQGRGSRFWFTARFTEQRAPLCRARTPLAELRGLRVLVVDDNVTNLDVLSRQLETWGMRVSKAGNGKSALETLETASAAGDPFALAILDMWMPGMDGAELGRLIQEKSHFRDMPLVMLTSVGFPGDARRFQDQGFAGYMNKPIRHAELKDVLLTVLGRTQCSVPSQSIITRHVAREGKRLEHGHPRLRGTVLVVDDNQVNLMVAVGILKKFGLATLTATNGLEALKTLETTPCDLILMDVMMPEMDGLEATREIRRRENDAGMLECWNAGIETSSKGTGTSVPVNSRIPEFQNSRIPVIAMTAGAMKEDREKCLEAGMDGYVSKPVNPYELGQALAQWLPVAETGGQKTEDGGRKREKNQTSNVSETKKQSPAIFDRESLLRVCMNDGGVAEQVMEMFTEMLPLRLESLRSSWELGDFEAINQDAHGIKGAALNAGCQALAAAAGALELAAKNGGERNITPLLATLVQEAERAQAELRGYIHGEHQEFVS